MSGENGSSDDVFVFGYGSLIWKQNFDFVSEHICYIKGFKRVFYQGSTDHRGVPGKPGRVVTLIPCSDMGPDAVVFGKAFRIAADKKAEVLAALDHREKGGYDRVTVPCYDPKTNDVLIRECLCYIATEDNEEYLGPAPDKAIAEQIVRAHGPSGPNIEYLLMLADGLRLIGVQDPHVFTLEEHAVCMMKEGQPCES